MSPVYLLSVSFRVCYGARGDTSVSLPRSQVRSTHFHFSRSKINTSSQKGGAAGTRTPDLRRARAALSQLSYGPPVKPPAPPTTSGVGAPGLEPGTSALSGPRSNHLSYAPILASKPLLFSVSISRTQLSTMCRRRSKTQQRYDVRAQTSGSTVRERPCQAGYDTVITTVPEARSPTILLLHPMLDRRVGASIPLTP